MFYKTLFQINFHHGYFLDIGNKKFLPTGPSQTELSDEQKEKSLIKYNFLDFLQIIPTERTQKNISNYRLAFKKTQHGVTLLASTFKDQNSQKFIPRILFDNDLVFTFEIKASDINFEYYTELNPDKNRLFLFTNTKPLGEENSFETIFQNSDTLIEDNFLLTQQNSRNLISTLAYEEFENEGFKSIVDSLEAIDKDTSLSNEEKQEAKNGVLDQVISKARKNQIIGFLRLSVKGDTQDLVEFSGQGQFTLENELSNTLSFINKQTFWRFTSSIDKVKLTTKEKYWLSKHGFIQIEASDFEAIGLDPPTVNPSDYKFPNPEVTSLTKVGNEYYSEIFI